MLNLIGFTPLLRFFGRTKLTNFQRLYCILSPSLHVILDLLFRPGALATDTLLIGLILPVDLSVKPP